MAAGGQDKPKKEGSKLSPLGQQLERSLVSMLKDLDKAEVEETVDDGQGGKKTVKKPKYGLLDRLRVYDRALKLEAIKHKIEDEEGSFFNGGKGGADGD